MSAKTPYTALLTFAIILTAGCASAPPQDMIVRIQAPSLTAPSVVEVSDLRPSSAKRPRPDPDGQIVYLGDAAFDPSPVLLVSRFLSARAAPSQAPVTIELVRFDVGISNSEVRDIYRSSPATVIIQGAAAGPLVIGNLLGQLLVAGFDSRASNQSVIVNVQLRGPTGAIDVNDFGALYSGRSMSDAIQTVVPRALDSLAMRVAHVREK